MQHQFPQPELKLENIVLRPEVRSRYPTRVDDPEECKYLLDSSCKDYVHRLEMKKLADGTYMINRAVIVFGGVRFSYESWIHRCRMLCLGVCEPGKCVQVLDKLSIKDVPLKLSADEQVQLMKEVVRCSSIVGGH